MSSMKSPWMDRSRDFENMEAALQELSQWVEDINKSATLHQEDPTAVSDPNTTLHHNPVHPYDLYNRKEQADYIRAARLILVQNLRRNADFSRAFAIVVACVAVLRMDSSQRRAADQLKIHPHTLDRYIRRFMERVRHPDAQGNPYSIYVLAEFM